MPGVVLECSQHGDFDSFDVIRSLTSMVGITDSDLPEPIATGLLTMYYVDTTVIEGATYYYKFRVWRGDESLVSDEVKVYTELDVYASYVKALLRFDGNLDDDTGLVWNKPIVTYDTGVFDQAANLNSQMTAPNNVGSQPFTVEFFCKPISYGAPYPCVFSFGEAWGAGYIGIYVRRSGMGDFLSCFTYDKPTISTTCNILDGQFHHLALSYDGTLLRLFSDGILVGSENISGFSVSATTLLRDIGQNSFECWLDEFRLTEGVARYVSNFTPPTQPHPAL